MSGAYAAAPLNLSKQYYYLSEVARMLGISDEDLRYEIEQARIFVSALIQPTEFVSVDCIPIEIDQGRYDVQENRMANISKSGLVYLYTQDAQDIYRFGSTKVRRISDVGAQKELGLIHEGTIFTIYTEANDNKGIEVSLRSLTVCADELRRYIDDRGIQPNQTANCVASSVAKPSKKLLVQHKQWLNWAKEYVSGLSDKERRRLTIRNSGINQSAVARAIRRLHHIAQKEATIRDVLTKNPSHWQQ